MRLPPSSRRGATSQLVVSYQRKECSFDSCRPRLCTKALIAIMQAGRNSTAVLSSSFSFVALFATGVTLNGAGVFNLLTIEGRLFCDSMQRDRCRE